MINKRRIAAIAGGGILAVSAALGLAACATTTPNSTSQAGPSQQARPPIDTTAMAKALATKLGVPESKVTAALDTALQSAMPSAGGGAPSGGAPSGAPGNGAAPDGAPSGGGGQGGGQRGGGDRTEMLAAVATSMASQLDLKQATVQSALQDVWSSYGPGGQPSATANG